MSSSQFLPTLSGWKRFQQTLRFRLAIMNAIVVVIISMTVLLLVRQGVEWTLFRELDQLLVEDLQEVVLSIQDHPSDELSRVQEELTRKSLGHRHHGWFAMLRDRSGAVVWKTETAPQVELPITKEVQSPYEFDGLRIASRAIPRQPYGLDSVAVGANLEYLKQDIIRINRQVMTAALLLMVVSPLCGYWLAGRATLTVGEIIQTATRLRPSHLEERLTLRGTNDELDLLAMTINGLLDRIATYLTQRREFLANAAHELRTPLAAIRSSIEVALDGREMTEEEQSLLENLIHQVHFLEVLVNQLLVISEHEIGQWAFDPETVPLHEVVQRAIDMFQGVAETSGIDLSFLHMQPVLVSGSRRYLRQVANNLIDNAVKYTTAGGTIQVSLVEDPERPGWIQLSVADTGIGIEEQDVPRVFERFFRSDRGRVRQTPIQGTGLGLSICEAVITAHGGTISCQSRLHHGTTLTVRLPYVKLLASNQEGDEAPPAGTAGKAPE